MDSTTSGSMQSSSGGGGGDDEFSSHPHEYISSFLTFPPPPPQPPNSTPFDPFSTFLSPFPPPSNPSNLTHPPPRADAAHLMITANFHPQPPPPPPTSLPSNTATVQPPAPRGGSRKRSRASRKPPTTVLTTDTSNFRAMVQEFTGFPTPPFASSSSPFVRPRLGLLHPTAAAVSAPPPPYLLRPSPQKAQTVIDAIASIARNSNYIGSSSSSSEQQRRQQQQQQQQVQQSNLLGAPIFGNLAFQSPVASKSSSHNNMSVFFEKQQQRAAQTTELIAGDHGLGSWIDYDGLDQVQTQPQTQSLFGPDVGDYAHSQGVDYSSRLSSSSTPTEMGGFHAADKGVGLLSHVDVNGRR